MVKWFVFWLVLYSGSRIARLKWLQKATSVCYTPLCRAQDFLSSTFMASVIHIMVPLNSYFCLVLSYVQTWISNYLFDNNTYRSQQAQSTWVKQILGALILSPAFPLHPQCHGSRPSTRSRVQTIVRSCSLHLTYLSPACSSSPSVPRTAFSSRRLDLSRLGLSRRPSLSLPHLPFLQRPAHGSRLHCFFFPDLWNSNLKIFKRSWLGTGKHTCLAHKCFNMNKLQLHFKMCESNYSFRS